MPPTTEPPREHPATWRQKADFFARLAGVALSGLPTGFPLPLTHRLATRFRHERFMTKLHAMPSWARFCVKHILKAHMDVQGTHNLPQNSRGYMYICNHQSHADILVLMSVLDSAAFLSKNDIEKLPIYGRAAHAGGTVYVNRRDPHSRSQALEETLTMCKKSTAVVVFPEGTTSENGQLRDRIYPKAMERAFEEGLILVPMALHGTYSLMPETLDRINTHTPVAVRIGPPLHPENFKDGGQFSATCWNAVKELHSSAVEAFDNTASKSK